MEGEENDEVTMKKDGKSKGRTWYQTGPSLSSHSSSSWSSSLLHRPFLRSGAREWK